MQENYMQHLTDSKDKFYLISRLLQIQRNRVFQIGLFWVKNSYEAWQVSLLHSDPVETGATFHTARSTWYFDEFLFEHICKILVYWNNLVHHCMVQFDIRLHRYKDSVTIPAEKWINTKSVMYIGTILKDFLRTISPCRTFLTSQYVNGRYKVGQADPVSARNTFQNGTKVYWRAWVMWHDFWSI